MNRIESAEDLERMALKIGFLPFFKNSIEGFSVEEHTSEEYWFADDREKVLGNGKAMSSLMGDAYMENFFIAKLDFGFRSFTSILHTICKIIWSYVNQ